MVAQINSSRETAINQAAKIISSKPVYLDTETTGLNKTDEVIEISIVDYDGTELLSTLIRPSQPIPASAQRIHGISDKDVQNSQPWPIHWQKIRNLLYGRTIAAYNSPFDLRLMQQSHARYKLPWRENFNFVDVLNLYSIYRNTWDPIRSSLKFYRLEEAGQYFNISLPNAHRSTADSLLTRAVLHCIAGLPY